MSKVCRIAHSVDLNHTKYDSLLKQAKMLFIGAINRNFPFSSVYQTCQIGQLCDLRTPFL